LKDEVKADFGPGHFISSFTSLGPKTYSYTVLNTAGAHVWTELKCKGLTLSAQALEVVTREVMEVMAEARDNTRAIAVPQFTVSLTSPLSTSLRHLRLCLQINRNILKNRLFSARLFKRLRWSSTKRFFVAGSKDGDTLPYGFGAVEGDDNGLSELIDALNAVIDEPEVASDAVFA
jgi:hypothetical protein